MVDRARVAVGALRAGVERNRGITDGGGGEDGTREDVEAGEAALAVSDVRSRLGGWDPVFRKRGGGRDETRGAFADDVVVGELIPAVSEFEPVETSRGADEEGPVPSVVPSVERKQLFGDRTCVVAEKPPADALA